MIRHTSNSFTPSTLITPSVSAPSRSQTSLASQTPYRQTLYHTSPTDASFVDDLGADSLDVVVLVKAFEEGFELEIPDEDAEKITTIKTP